MRIDVDQIFNREEPLGPYVTPDPLHETSNKVTFSSFYDGENFLSRQSLSNSPTILMGRRGSGKTALLFHLRFSGGYVSASKLDSERVFTEVATHVGKLGRGCDDHDALVETVSSIWRKVILTTCICQFYQRHQNERFAKGSPELKTIESFLRKANLIGKRSSRVILSGLIQLANATLGKDFDFVTDFLDDYFESEIGFSEALDAMCELLNSADSRGIILIDSLEQFPIDKLDMCEALSGLLHFVGQFDLEYRPVHIAVCLPAELHEDFGRISDNVEKDFRKVLTLHWDPAELFQMCGHRFSVFLRRNPGAFNFETTPLKERPSRQDVWDFWAQFMPELIVNRYGIRENAISYISRHTQLLPRHALNIMNKIAMLALAGRRDDGFSEDDIIKGVRLGEGVICEGVFSGFKQKYPQARDIAKLLLPNLPNLVTYPDLQRVNRNFGKGLMRDTGELLEMCIRMGILGKLVDRSEIYDTCRFDYTYNGTMPYSVEDSFGVHPAFSGQFGNNFTAREAAPERFRPIYPVETFTGDRRGTGALLI